MEKLKLYIVTERQLEILETMIKFVVVKSQALEEIKSQSISVEVK